MVDGDEDDNGGLVYVRLMPRPWRWINAAGASLQFGSNMANCIGAYLEDLATQAAQANAWRNSRADAVLSMHADLEQL